MDCSNTAAYAVDREDAPTLSRNQEMDREKPPETSHDMNAAVQQPPAVVFRRGKGRRRRTHSRKMPKEGCCNGAGGEELKDEKAEVERKIAALQKIVPGGDRLAVETLFEETAEYILALEWQVKALRFLAAFVEGSDMEKRKLGG
ncbi:transcription factor PAR2 [Sesamum indicum]|uniref:Transcription factor PAR2 n=1 Tax=Sesamum indicum TaxID=4182 RepID=A0A6I9UAU9_SESIN|nr:transcription factor PAR2 [Sesamum indicum]